MSRNLIAAGAKMHARYAKASASVQAWYRRYAGTGVASAYRFPVTVWPLQRRELTTNPAGASGATLASTDQDFGIAVADFPAKLVQPAEEDWIEYVENGEVKTYELKGNGGQPAWSLNDTAGVTYRLRGKLIQEQREAPIA